MTATEVPAKVDTDDVDVDLDDGNDNSCLGEDKHAALIDTVNAAFRLSHAVKYTLKIWREGKVK